MILNPHLMNRIEAIDWFAHCGEPLALPLHWKTRPVSSWEQAAHYYTHPKWELATLHAQNALTVHLHSFHPNRFADEWNPVARAAKAFFAEKIESKIRRIQEQQGLEETFLQSVRYDLLGVFQEDHFSDCDLPLRFHSDLLVIYEAGHFPCGWGGKGWPHGWLFVF